MAIKLGVRIKEEQQAQREYSKDAAKAKKVGAPKIEKTVKAIKKDEGEHEALLSSDPVQNELSEIESKDRNKRVVAGANLFGKKKRGS